MNRFGVVTRRELLDAGVPNSTITRKYRRVLPGVYSVDEPTWLGRCSAVHLWRPDATLSHRTAAFLYGWIDQPEIIEATIPAHTKARTPAWLTVYRRDLPAGVLTTTTSLPVVTRTQALIDCVAVMEPDAAGRLVDERLGSGMDQDLVRSLMRAVPKRRGNARTLVQLSSASTGFASEPERVLDRTLIARGLRLRTNVRIGAFVVDFLDELARLIVEVDGRKFHIEPEVFRYDRRRQNWLVQAGYRVLRYAAYDVMENPDGVADEIAAEIRRRRHARR